NLIQTQIESFKWFCDEGLGELFAEISPIQDFTGKNLDLKFISSEFREPKYSEEECRTKDLTFSKPLWPRVKLVNRSTGEISVKVDRKRKLTVTTLLRAIGYSSNEEIAALFTNLDADPEHQYIASTLEKDPTTNTNEGLVEVYKRLRPGDPPTIDNARSLVQSLFFNFRRYDLAKVGRYKLNRKLGLDLPMTQRTLTNEDLVRIVGRIIELNNGKGQPDDID